MISEIGLGVSALSSLFGRMGGAGTTASIDSNGDFGSIFNEVVSSDGSKDSSSTSKSSSEMDLNNDGQVTMAEMVKYLELQSQQQIAENTDVADMGDFGQENPFSSRLQTGVKQALRAYSAMI